MQLKELIQNINPRRIIGDLNIEIKKIAYDSRQVEEDGLLSV